MADRIVRLSRYSLTARLRIVYGSLYEISITQGSRDGELVRTVVLHSKYGVRDAKNRFQSFINREYP